MANFPLTLPSATPADHGDVVDEVREMAKYMGIVAPVPSGVWGSPSEHAANSQTNAVGDVRVYREEFPPGTSLTGMAINVATIGSAGATKTLLCYRDTGASMPGALIKATAALATDGSTGFKSETFAGVDISGVVWFGTLTLVATSVISGITTGRRGVFSSSLTLGNGVWTGYIMTGQTSVPDPFTTTRTPINGLDRVLYQTG